MRKTQYCEILSKKIGEKTYSASNLILEAGKQNFTQKKVKDIDFNQSLLVQKVREMKSMGMDFILDGHLSLLDKTGAIHLIDEKVIQSLGIDLLIVLVEKPCIIQKRVKDRDGILCDEQFIDQFQQKEVEYARQLGLKLRLDYKIVTLPNEDDINFGKSLILSIKPTYAKKILSGEKNMNFGKNFAGKTVRYENPLELESLGINFVPQSYAYVDTL